MGQLLGGLGSTAGSNPAGGLGSGQQHGSALSLSDFFKMDEDQQAAVTAELTAAGGSSSGAARGPAAAACGTAGGIVSPPLSPAQRLSSLHTVQQMHRFEGSAGNLVDMLGGPAGGVGSPGSLLLHGFGSDSGDAAVGVGGAAAGPDGGNGTGSLLYSGLGLGGFGSTGHLNLLGTPSGRGGGFMDLESLAHLGGAAGSGSLRHGGSPPENALLFGDLLPALGGSSSQRQQQQGLGSMGGVGTGFRAQGGGVGEGFLSADDDGPLGKRGSSTGGPMNE